MCATLEDLYKLFYTKDLVINKKFETKIDIPIKNTNFDIGMTPFTKMIYDNTSPNSKQYLLEDIVEDNIIIERLSDKTEKLDPDYQEKMENNGLGFFMEDFVSVHFNCPVCNQKTLRKYRHSNVPVVDLVCINTEYHSNNASCFLFQLKISTTNTYFNLNENTIIIGSKYFGVTSHLNSPASEFPTKIVTPGYICLKLIPTYTEKQEYRIDYAKSFAVYPEYDIDPSQNNPYYQYLENPTNIYSKPEIRWNSNICHLLSIKKIFSGNIIKYDVYGASLMENPYKFLIKLLE